MCFANGLFSIWLKAWKCPPRVGKEDAPTMEHSVTQVDTPPPPRERSVADVHKSPSAESVVSCPTLEHLSEELSRVSVPPADLSGCSEQLHLKGLLQLDLLPLSAELLGQSLVLLRSHLARRSDQGPSRRSQVHSFAPSSLVPTEHEGAVLWERFSASPLLYANKSKTQHGKCRFPLRERRENSLVKSSLLTASWAR